MKSTKLFLLFILLSSSLSINAQDIIRTTKDTIMAKVLEIGLDEIKYKDFNNLDGPVIVITKSDVIEITYQNGSKFFIAPDPYDANKEVAVRNKTKSIKFEFFSPLTQDIAFGFETMLKVGTNLEFKAAVIGPGTGQNPENASGFWVKGGVKFLTSPTYVQNGVKYSHGLKGFYIKPELIFGTYTKDKIYYNNYYYQYNPTTQKVRFTNVCVNIVFGKQYILGNLITLDYYFGAGYGLHVTSDRPTNLPYYESDEEGYSYSHIYSGKDFPLIITGGLTLGILF